MSNSLVVKRGMTGGVSSLAPASRESAGPATPRSPIRPALTALAVALLVVANGACITIKGRQYPPWIDGLVDSGCTIAVESPATGLGTLDILVRDANGKVLPGVKVRVSDAAYPGSEAADRLTDCEGRVHLSVRPARWRVEPLVPGLKPGFEDLGITAGQTCSVRFYLAISESAQETALGQGRLAACSERRWQPVRVGPPVLLP